MLDNVFSWCYNKGTKNEKGVQKMTANELAKKCNCSRTWIYALAKRLGRLPTEDEVNARKGKVGAPLKYKEKNENQEKTMIGLLIVNIIGCLILLCIMTTIVVIYFKQAKEHKKEKAEYEKKINYYIKELVKRAKVEFEE